MNLEHPARNKGICIRIAIVLILSILIKPSASIGMSPTLPAIQVSNCTALQNIQSNLSGQYTLTGDIDCSASAAWNGGLGFSAIGFDDDPFVGSFDGQGHTISGLTIHWLNAYEVGLFGHIGLAGEVKDVHLEDIDIQGTYYVGGLAGMSWGSISGVSVSGVITGSDIYVGGLVGQNNNKISHASSSASVTSLSKDAGGLAGGNGGSIRNSSATGSVYAGRNAGGLVGVNTNLIDQSYATSPVYSAATSVGVNSFNAAGGLVGWNYSGRIQNAYATGSVGIGSGDSAYVGGLVGINHSGFGELATVQKCYSKGFVSGGAGSSQGGLIGHNTDAADAIMLSYWDRITSGQIASDGGTGKTSTQMKQQATYVDWDFAFIWSIEEGLNYPQLRDLTLFEVKLPVVMRNSRELSILLGENLNEQGISIQHGGDVDTLVYILSVNPELSVHGTGNGDILPSPDQNQIADAYMQFDVEDAVMFDEPATTRVLVQVDYADIGTDTFRIEYDAHTGGATGDGRFKQTNISSKSNSGYMRTTYFVLDEVKFANRTNGGDFRIDDMHDGVDYIRKVTVIRLPPSP